MKRKLFLIAGLFGLFLFAIIFVISSCKKAVTTTTDDTSFASDNAIAESNSSDVKNISDQAANGTLSTYVATAGDLDLLGCATITRDTVSVPHKITIDFGTTNCTCIDGRNRRGKIIVSYTGKYYDSNIVIRITFNGYAVNDYLVAGSKTITNKGHNSSGHPVYSIVDTSRITVPNGGGTINWNCNRQNEYIAGYKPLVWYNIQYYITGTANGVSAKGLAYTLNTVTPLLIKLTCNHITSGILQITLPASGITATLNYGNGTCDPFAVLTYNGKSYNIIL